MWIVRCCAAWLALLAVAWFFDEARVNPLVSSFVIASGDFWVFLGLGPREGDGPAVGTSLAIPYQWRVIGGVAAVGFAVLQLAHHLPQTSGVAAAIAVVLLSYHAPWLHRRQERPEPS